jgi:hypothetical protein
MGGLLRRRFRGIDSTFLSGGGTPIGDNLRPRAIITAAEVPAVQSWIAGDATVLAKYNAWIATLDAATHYSLDASGLSAGYNAAQYAQAALLRTGSGITGASYGHTRAQYVTKATTLMTDLASTGCVAGYLGDCGGQTYGWYFHAGAALAYDWIFDDLSGSDKTLLGNWLQTGTYAGAGTWNSVYGGAWPAAQALSGIVTKGAGINDTFADAKLAAFNANFRGADGATYSNSYAVGLGADTGGAPQGVLYFTSVNAHGGAGAMILLAEEAYRTAYGISRATHYGGTDVGVFRYYPRFLADQDANVVRAHTGGPNSKQYTMLKSWGGNSYETYGIGDNTNHGWFTSFLGMHIKMFTGVDSTQVGVAQWLLNNRVGFPVDGYWGYGYWDFLYFLTGSTPTPISPSAAGFPISSSAAGDGRWALRTAWPGDTNSEGVIHILAPKWITNVDGNYQNPGGYEIYRAGTPMVIQQGEKGHDSMNSRHFTGHNVLTFVDTTKSHRSSVQDASGGLRYGSGSAPAGASVLTTDSQYDARGTTLEDLYDGSGVPGTRDYDYLRMDLTKSRDAAACVSWEREHVWFRLPSGSTDPLWHVVIDRAETTGTTIELRNLFHPSADPTVNGTRSAGPARGATVNDGKTTGTDATLVSWTQTATFNGVAFSGKGWMTPTLPTSRRLIKVWGAGSGGAWQPLSRSDASDQAGQGVSTDSHEIEDAYGYLGKLESSPAAGYVPFIGAGHTEIVPVTAATQETFCRLEEMAGTSDSQTPTASSLTSTMGGAFFDGSTKRGIVFKLVNPGALPWTAVLPKQGTWRIVFSGLPLSASRTFTPGGAGSSNLNIESGGTGVAYVGSANAKGVRYVNVVVANDGTGTNNLVTIT